MRESDRAKSPEAHWRPPRRAARQSGIIPGESACLVDLLIQSIPVIWRSQGPPTGDSISMRSISSRPVVPPTSSSSTWRLFLTVLPWWRWPARSIPILYRHLPRLGKISVARNYTILWILFDTSVMHLMVSGTGSSSSSGPTHFWTSRCGRNMRRCWVYATSLLQTGQVYDWKLCA